MVLKNLKVALEQKGIAVRALAGIMGVSERTAWNKINEDTDITYREAKKISEELFPEYKLEYLFDSDREELEHGKS